MEKHEKDKVVLYFAISIGCIIGTIVFIGVWVIITGELPSLYFNK